jgi:citrate lyase beta subunit
MELFVFTVDPRFARDVVTAGAAGLVVDWEVRGKHRRQAGADTEVNAHTAADLARVRAATPGRILCRLNAVGPWTAAEVECAVALGADEVLLPMVRCPEEVDRAVELVGGRVGVGILVETSHAVRRVDELVTRPLSRVYVGLNDLRIDRGSSALFEPLVDGTVERLRRAVPMPFGVAGLTLPEGGHPVPSRLLAAELARLDASFTFLRRSFHADVAGRDLGVELPRILAAMATARRRPPEQVEADRVALVAAVGGQLVAV